MPAPVRAYGRTAQGQPDFQSAVSPAGFSDGQQPVGADRQSQSDLAQAPAAPTTPANQTRISIQPPAVKSVTAKGQSVEITFDDGTIETRRGGSRTWRTNNPEAIEYGDVARRHGAVGHDGRFAIFPNEEAGKRAAIAILKSSKYQAKTIGEAIASWAPPQENNTAAYQRFVEHLTGLNGSTPMHSLTQSQLDRVYEAIKRFEGWLPGPPRARP